MAAFTTIAAGVGLAATAGGTAMSFTQASKQKKLQREAESDAVKAMAEARKKLDVNFYEQLGIQKEPYELEREALLAAGAQATQAGVESERGAAATAGRVQMAQQQGQRQIAAAMGQEMLGLEKLAAQEESRLRDMGVGLDLEEAAGSQLAAREAARMSAAATTQGVQGIQSMAGQLAGMAPLFEKTAGARQFGRMENLATDKYGLSQADFQKNIANLGTVGGVDFSRTASMNPMQFQAFMGSVNPQVLSQIRQNMPNTLQSFNPAAPQPTFNNPFAIPGIGVGY
jgi:hypothetical protein